MKRFNTTLLLVLLTIAVIANTTTSLLFGLEVAQRVVLIISLVVPACGISLVFLIACKLNQQLRKISGELYDKALGSAFACDLRSAASQTNATSAQELAIELDQASATLDSAGYRVAQLADNSLTTGKLTTETRHAADSLAGYVGDLGNAIEANKTAEREFSTLLRTADELAHQLNVLTVNTAIQSARTGKDTAGFAVVTGEMRRLAIQYDAVSKETATKLKAAFLRSAHSIEICDKANRAVKEIQTKSHQSEKLAAEVVRDLREHTSCFSQLQPALVQTTRTAQSHATRLGKTAAESEEFTAHSESLTAVVLRLHRMVNGTTSGAGDAPEKAQMATPPPAEHSPASVNTITEQTKPNRSPKNYSSIPLHAETT